MTHGGRLRGVLRTGVAVGCLACCGAADQAFAASAGTTPTEVAGDTRIGEVVVTTRKREERLQDVPVPVSAFNANDITAKAAINLTGLSDSIPNVFLETVSLFPNAASFAMRGVGAGGIESFQDPRVAVYIDGAYQTRAASGPGDMFDIDTVEVLRGPQGALYGRNAFAGAIAIRSRRATGQFSGNAEATIGNYGRYDFQAAVNIPIVGDKLDLRVAYMHRQYDGYGRIENISGLPNEVISGLVGRDITPELGKSVGGNLKNAFRVDLRFRPVSGVDANLIVTETEPRGNGASQVNQALPGSVFGLFGFPGRDPFGDYTLGIKGDGSDPFITGSSYGNLDREHDLDVLGDLTVDIGGGKWYTLVDYHQNNSLIITDTDGELVDLFSSTRAERFSQFQVETRYQHKYFDDRLDVLAGVFYLRDYFNVFQRLQLGFGAAGNPALNPPLAPTPPFQFATDGRSSSNQMQNDGERREAIAPYFQINFNVTQKLRLNAALRYSKEWRKAFDDPLQTPVGPPGPGALSNDFHTLATTLDLATTCGTKTASFDSLSPGLGIDYKATPDILLFFSWQRAFKSGGLNVNGTCASFASTPYKDEQVDNFEVGVKSELFDHRLRLNVNAFRAEYSNLQIGAIRVNPNNPAAADTFIGNAAGALIYGVETELTAKPTRALTLYANVGWLTASYSNFCTDLVGITTFTGPPPTSTCGGVTILMQPTEGIPGQALIDVDYSKKKYQVPEWDGQIGATYRFDLGNVGSLTADASVHYTSDVPDNVRDQIGTGRSPLTHVDASLSWADVRGRYRLTAWGRNINNDVTRLSATYVAPLFVFAGPTDPRTFGATLTVSF
jgi:iron complex outermembrane receptor protein